MTKPEWGKFRVVVVSKEVEGGIPKPPPMIKGFGISSSPFMISRVGYATMGMGMPSNYVMMPAPQDNVTVICKDCSAPNDAGQDFCDRCGEPLLLYEENIQNDYYTGS